MVSVCAKEVITSMQQQKENNQQQQHRENDCSELSQVNKLLCGKILCRRSSFFCLFQATFEADHQKCLREFMRIVFFLDRNGYPPTKKPYILGSILGVGVAWHFAMTFRLFIICDHN